ncbi:MAG TPA: hypothetical protein PKB06_00130, partial [Actinotalea sp.]|nr:hypothetical protein [Actinotalea sp.]
MTAQSAAVMSGLVVVGLVVLALASTVLVRRRGAVLAHQRAVGASLTGVATGLGVESAVLVAAGGAVGVLAGRAVAPGAAGWAWAAAVLVPALLVGPAVGTLVAARSVAPPRPLDRRRRRGAALRRPLAEVTLGLVALAALALLRTRGAAASRATLGADLVVLAAPTLAAAAVAILLARVLPLVVARMRRLAGLGRGPVALVAAAG